MYMNILFSAYHFAGKTPRSLELRWFVISSSLALRRDVLDHSSDSLSGVLPARPLCGLGRHLSSNLLLDQIEQRWSRLVIHVPVAFELTHHPRRKKGGEPAARRRHHRVTAVAGPRHDEIVVDPERFARHDFSTDDAPAAVQGHDALIRSLQRLSLIHI